MSKIKKNNNKLRSKFYNILKRIFYKYIYKFDKPNFTIDEWKNVHQSYEKEGWGECKDGHVVSEEKKQPVYARLMGISLPHNANGKSILDVGGGPISMLLKTKNFSKATVVDPCDYPAKVIERYKNMNIEFVNDLAENFLSSEKYDEVWCYNVLQHTMDPNKILENMKNNSKGIIRIFEWVYAPVSVGHPQFITREMIEDVFNKDGWEWESFDEKYINESGCVGWAVFGFAKKK